MLSPIWCVSICTYMGNLWYSCNDIRGYGYGNQHFQLQLHKTISYTHLSWLIADIQPLACIYVSSAEAVYLHLSAHLQLIIVQPSYTVITNNISSCYSNFANLQTVHSTIYTVILYLLFQLNYFKLIKIYLISSQLEVSHLKKLPITYSVRNIYYCKQL